MAFVNWHIAFVVGGLTAISPMTAFAQNSFWSGASAHTQGEMTSLGAAFVQAAAATDTAEVKTLIRLGVPIDYQDEGGRTALWYAARAQQADMILNLLRDGASPDLADREGVTPLHLLARSSRSAGMAQWLLEHGANINAVDGAGDTPLMIALANDPSADWISWWLIKGANPFIPSASGQRPADRIRQLSREGVQRAQSANANTQSSGGGGGGGFLRNALTFGVTAYSGVEAGLLTDIVAGAAMGMGEGGGNQNNGPGVAGPAAQAWYQVEQLLARAEVNCGSTSARARNCVGGAAIASTSLRALEIPDQPGPTDWGFATPTYSIDRQDTP